MKRVFQRLRLPGPRHPLCLYLHSISASPFSGGLGPDIFLPPEELKAALQVFAIRTKPQPLKEIVENYSRCWTGPRALSLTFDDGFRDNLDTALPLLEEFDIPVTIFVTTGFVDREVLPYEMVLAAVLRNRTELAVKLPSGMLTLQVASAAEKHAAYRELTTALKPVSHSVREHFIESLAPEESVLKSIRNLFLNWDELALLHAHPLVTIGAHTRNHLSLAHQELEVVLAEMKQSRIRLAEQLGASVTSFAFPYGSHNASALALAREAGFSLAVTTRRDLIRLGNDPLAVPRCKLSSASAAVNLTRAMLR